MNAKEEIDKRMEGMKDLMRRKAEPACIYMDEHHRMTWQSGFWAGFAARQEWDDKDDAEMLERMRKIPFGDVKRSVDKEKEIG